MKQQLPAVMLILLEINNSIKNMISFTKVLFSNWEEFFCFKGKMK